jgi:gas vesicle protein
MNDRTPYVTPFFCFLAGSVAGAAAVLLWAPQSGRATRETLARKLGETADTARQLRDRALQKGRRIRGEAAQRASEAASAPAGRDGHELSGEPASV